MKQFEETLPLILEAMLSFCLMDVENTVRAAAKKVCMSCNPVPVVCLSFAFGSHHPLYDV